MRKAILFLTVLSLTCFSLASLDIPDPYDPEVWSSFDVNIDSLGFEAHKAYLSGDFASSAAMYLAVAQRDMKNNSVLYNLACCYGLLGQEKLASIFLEKAYRAGFTDLEHIKSDPDFEKVRSSERFSAAMDSLVVWNGKKPSFSGDEHFIKSTVYTKYEVYLPGGYDQSKTYPMIVGLHGYGGDLKRFARLLRLMKDRQVIYVVPEAPYPFMVGRDIGYSWSLWGMTDDEDLSNDSFAVSIDYVMNICAEVKREYPVGKSYLMGFSQGAMLTFITGITRHENFDGLIGMGGELFVDVVQDKLDEAKQLPIYIIHGRGDNVVPYESANEAVEVFEKHGMTYHLESFDGGHQVDRESFFKALEYFGIE